MVIRLRTDIQLFSGISSNNIQIGLWSAFVSCVYLIIADYLLNYFSSSWLLLTALMVFPLSIPALWANRKKYVHWKKTSWLSFALVGILSGAYNLSFLISADQLPISVASMFLSVASVLVLPLTCLMANRLPQKLEIFSILFVFVGVALVLQLQLGSYSWVGLIFGFATTFLSANATIYSSKSRKILLASEAMISKQLGKLVFALIGFTIFVEQDSNAADLKLSLWCLLGLYGVIKIYDTFIASRAQFMLPPLVFQSLSLLSLPMVCVGEVIIFKGSFTLLQWTGVIAIIVAGFMASLSKQTQLKAIQ